MLKRFKSYILSISKRLINYYYQVDRDLLAKRYLYGSGIEIGALYHPLKVPSYVKVKYLDRLSVPELRVQYPDLKSKKLVGVDIIDDGETLVKVGDGSHDFIIANHFLEHCEDPIKALRNMLRAVKTGGILFITIPDKRFTLDKGRPVTKYEHLVKDYRQGPQWSRRGHFKEFIHHFMDIKNKKPANEKLEYFTKINYSIHYHVWTTFEFAELLYRLVKEMRFPLEIEALVLDRNAKENIIIIKKTGSE